MKLINLLIFLLIGTVCSGQDLKEIESLYLKRDFDGVITEGKRILEEHPENLLVNHFIGRAHTTRHFEKSSDIHLG